jgi:hypothetical protein
VRLGRGSGHLVTDWTPEKSYDPNTGVPAMQIEIPQYISAHVGRSDGKRVVYVYIGDAIVYVHKCDQGSPRDNEEDLRWEGITAFGKMLALKIGD